MKKFFVVLVFFLILSLTNLFAQSINLTSPTSATIVPEGDDFATDELGNPWDFNERRDMGWEENFVGSSVSVSNGIWRGENQVAGGHFFPLFPGFKDSLFSEGISGDRKLPKYGINHKIKASKYYHLSYRLNVTDRSSYAIYWEGDESRPQYWPDPNSPRGASFDGYFNYGHAFRNSGFTYYSFNLQNMNSEFEQKQGSWSGNPYAFRIDPSIGGAVGARTEVDWIRLVDPNSAPHHTITWNSNNISSTAIITVFYDTNPSGYNGTPMRRFTYGSNPGTFTFPTATLPAGTYYFYVTARNTSGGNFVGSPIVSSYSAPLTIVPKPSVYITSPSMTSGEEYSSDVLRDPWDMTKASDIQNLDTSKYPDVFRQFTSPSFMSSNEAETGGRVFAAMADPPLPGNNESDVQLHLNVSKSNPIQTDKFRYLVYRINVDETLYPRIHDKIELGWVMRPVWWNNEFRLPVDSAKAHPLFEGWNTYATDLSKEYGANLNSPADPNIPPINETGIPWHFNRTINNLRLDPLETPFYTWFYLDYVRLYAENRASSGFFDISYVVNNPVSGNVTTRIYRTNSKNSSQRTLIATRHNQQNGSHTYRWDTSNLPTESSYFIYIEVDNGVSKIGAFSPVHVKIGPYTPQARSYAPDFDFDGDGISDEVVYRGATGEYFMNKSSLGYQQIPWGNAHFTPIYGDFDGDGISDRGLVASFGGSLFWYIIRSSDAQLYARAWGLEGDKIVIGDYNGNGRDEIAIYRDGAWFILDEDDRGVVHYWGLAGIDIPVPADYDGDGKTDLAIYRKTDGMWWILYSGFSSNVINKYYDAVQWGLPWVGDVTVPADYTGDGRADVAVWRPDVGMWFVRSLSDNSVISQQWGLPGDIPLAGRDGNGNGVKNFTVYRPSIGTWFYNHRNGAMKGTQFGLPIDRLPVQRTM